MKKYFLILFSFWMFACNSNSSNEVILPENDTIPLTKEEEIVKIYNEAVLPLFKSYLEVEIPTAFKIDEDDLSINAGASFGYVEVSQGLINLTKEHIQLFALSHEVAHIVTITQARLFGLGGSIPKGSITNDYKKAEYLADLIAIHLIKSKLNNEFRLLSTDLPFLQNLLGGSSFTHPSGSDRINEIQTYLENSISTNNDEAFKTSFLRIWKME
ncbi:hypothetical protein QWY81_00025 [Polaribacter undariae]|uniref:Peptidase M48 domain-containing protein n=1 Tax=Polaribacter sejongensis TaxID=985043 RepID=A0AAJ1VDV1_9FLAO|nr:hypothetical protein [Polaribacter undariae]MDN3617833.1 hypothetical protein [Polaribacter undariae]UWD32156.1 hypothetical protein NQP51_00495 [Polaribacter undariae]